MSQMRPAAGGESCKQDSILYKFHHTVKTIEKQEKIDSAQNQVVLF